nr:hypothetical protein [Clostridia bacterium]
MKKKLLLIAPPILALILEILPYGAVLNFANQLEDGTIDTIRQTFSYFDLTPMGYANSGPILTAMLTCVITLIALIYILTAKKVLRSALSILCVIALVTSVMPMAYGMAYLSPVGIAITALLLVEAVLLTKIEL